MMNGEKIFPRSLINAVNAAIDIRTQPLSDMVPLKHLLPLIPLHRVNNTFISYLT